MSRRPGRSHGCCQSTKCGRSPRWAGPASANGELLQLAAAGFDAVLTADQNMQYQQNVGALPIAVIVLVAATSRIESLHPRVPTLLDTLHTLAPRQLVHVRV